MNVKDITAIINQIKQKYNHGVENTDAGGKSMTSASVTNNSKYGKSYTGSMDKLRTIKRPGATKKTEFPKAPGTR